jgi:hypothetical protein
VDDEAAQDEEQRHAIHAKERKIPPDLTVGKLCQPIGSVLHKNEGGSNEAQTGKRRNLRELRYDCVDPD